MRVANSLMVVDAALGMIERMPHHARGPFVLERDIASGDVIGRFDLSGPGEYSVICMLCSVWPDLDDVPVHAAVLKTETPAYILLTWTERGDKDPHSLGFLKGAHLTLHAYGENDDDAENTAQFLTTVIRAVLEEIAAGRDASKPKAMPYTTRKEESV